MDKNFSKYVQPENIIHAFLDSPGRLGGNA
jgi:hypothetical protein